MEVLRYQFGKKERNSIVSTIERKFISAKKLEQLIDDREFGTLLTCSFKALREVAHEAR